MKYIIHFTVALIIINAIMRGTLRKALNLHTAPKEWATWAIITQAYTEEYERLVYDCFTPQMLEDLDS